MSSWEDSIIEVIIGFDFENYGVHDFPVLDPDNEGPSELVVDLAHVIAQA